MTYQNGDVYIAFVNFVEDAQKDNAKGKVRPVVIFEDPEEGKLYACKVSSQVDKPIKKRLGYVMQDWQEAGFKAPSVIACDAENIHEINSLSITKKVGQLTEHDLRGLLIKHIKVLTMEHQRQKNREHVQER